MDRYEIEDTDDWLGSPTPLETCRHSLRIYENEVQELTLQLRQAGRKFTNWSRCMQKPSNSAMKLWPICGNDLASRPSYASSFTT